MLLGIVSIEICLITACGREGSGDEYKAQQSLKRVEVSSTLQFPIRFFLNISGLPIGLEPETKTICQLYPFAIFDIVQTPTSFTSSLSPQLTRLIKQSLILKSRLDNLSAKPITLATALN